MDYVLAEYVMKLADSCAKLSVNEKELIAIAADTTIMVKDLYERVRALEQQPDAKYEVFVTTKTGNCFPVKALASKQEAYYWIMDRITLPPVHWEVLWRFNDLSFGYDRKFKDFDVMRIEIRKT